MALRIKDISKLPSSLRDKLKPSGKVTQFTAVTEKISPKHYEFMAWAKTMIFSIEEQS